MAIADIVTKILQDAQDEAARLVAEAEAEAKQIRTDAESEMASSLEHIEKRGKEKAEQIKQKVENLAVQEEKTELLKGKRSMIDEVFQDAAAQLKTLPADKKEQILLSMISRIDVDKGTIFPTTGDEKLLESVAKKAGKSFSIGNPVPGAGGFRFVSSEVEIDFRFDELVRRELAVDLEREVADILFS